MNRVIIATTNLDRNSWNVFYQFIKCVLVGESGDSLCDNYARVKKIAQISVEWGIDKELSYNNVDSLKNGEESSEKLLKLSKDTCFSILYLKEDDSEDFVELVPFVLLQQEFGEAISLGIDIGKLDIKSQRSYKFKCSDFFILFDFKKSTSDNRSLYLINEKTFKKDTGEIVYVSSRHITNLAGKRESGEERYEGEASRRFLPLMMINESSYQSIFVDEIDVDLKENQFVKKSIDKIRKNIGVFSQLNSKLPGSSLFEQWLEHAYFFSFEREDLKSMTTAEVENIRKTIRVYNNSIVELIQNVIFYGGANGLIYCVFDRKNNISDYYKNRLPCFSEYEDNVRFLRTGILDFGEDGIVDTYKNKNKESESFKLSDFFDTTSIATTNLTTLEMRYAARLGIKTFVKTIINNRGYFSVESNETIDGLKRKKVIQTIVNDNQVGLSGEYINDFARGTHYEIVMPIIAQKNHNETVFPFQRVSLLSDKFIHRFHTGSINKTIKSIDFPMGEVNLIDVAKDKNGQIGKILDASEKILAEKVKIDGDKNSNILVLDLQGCNPKPIVVFKIASYLQLRSNEGYERLVFVNASELFVEEFFNLIKPLLTSEGVENVWSRSSAIVLISENLRIQCIWGKTCDELEYINQEFYRYYCNNFFVSNVTSFTKEYNKIEDYVIKKACGFVLPYDILITTNRNHTVFEEFIINLLKRKIISSGLGFLVNHNYTYIGSKIIVRNYYEADMIFQNSFFTERFAYLISRDLKKELINRRRSKDGGSKLILIGYKPYSEFLLKTIRRLLSDEKIFLVIGNEEKDTVEIDDFFDFDIGEGGREFVDDILVNPNDYYIATIVPIGSTLSTNDKIIAFFKQWFEYNNPGNDDSTDSVRCLSNDQFIYNHCVIIVRDEIGPNASALEMENKWDENGVDAVNCSIKTHYNNASELFYNVQIASAQSDNNGNWIKRLNDEISFPQKWWCEEYVNYTENSSINSQNLMGFPIADICNELSYRENLFRLYEFASFIYKGHIDVLGCHHKFYIDTESFVKKKTEKFVRWLKDLKNNHKDEDVFNHDKLNILFTPNSDRESDFISLVNEHVFDNSALIVYLDVKNWRNNMVHKLSFLKEMLRDRVRYHYLDHALLTGETYHTSQSLFYSITDSLDSKFETIITIVNRLPYAKSKEIKNDVNQRLFAYVDLYYPSNEGERGCELCKLSKYYDDLQNKTVLDGCVGVIRKNQGKLEVKDRRRGICSDGNQNRRNFLRLLMTHELYYRMAETVLSEKGNNNDFDSVSCSVEEKLNQEYSKLGHLDKMANFSGNLNRSFSQILSDWFYHDVFASNTALNGYYEKKIETDKKISFLKVISSPPLSQYITVRRYAYKLLLAELHSIIDKREKVGYDDLKTLKAVLKSLSFLKSNALVRKDVIVGIWEVLNNVLNNIDGGLGRMELFLVDVCRVEKELCDFIVMQESQTQKRFFDEDLIKLQEKNHIIYDFRVELEQQIKRLKKKEWIIQDFSKDVQFFIKNAINDDEAKATFLGELLRRGSEMTDFNDICISQTSVYFGGDSDDDHSVNELFSVFRKNSNLVFTREYINFLVWLFYDNTTIIRKSLDNFAKELGKDRLCNKLFYDGRGSLLDVKDFENNISEACDLFGRKVVNEYYYHSFLPYLHNKDGIDFVKKLVYVTYAKLKLEDITSKKHKTEIERDTRNIMEVFTAIMGADAAFWTMRKEMRRKQSDEIADSDYRLYPISLFGKVGEGLENEWDYERWFLKNDFYTDRVFDFDEVKTPVIPLYRIGNSYGERRDLKMRDLAIFLITDSDYRYEKKLEEVNEEKKKPVVAAITFLYKPDNPLASNRSDFKINIQEAGRLLLLLKNNISEYVNDYLIKDKAFDLWEQKFWHIRRFEKSYANSAHRFNSVYGEMDEFESFNDDVISKMSNTWYFLSNETISFLYSNIERGGLSNHAMSVKEDNLINKNNTLGKTFNNVFVSILKSLFAKRWSIDNSENNEVCINGQPLNDFELEETLKDVKLLCNKNLFRTFIVQCLNNSLSPISRHGHRGECEVKRVDVTIKDTYVSIKDSVIKKYYDTEDLKRRAKQFSRKKDLICIMNCEEYSSTTLTTLQGFVNYTQKRNLGFDCDFGFDSNNNFCITIEFNKI